MKHMTLHLNLPDDEADALPDEVTITRVNLCRAVMVLIEGALEQQAKGGQPK